MMHVIIEDIADPFGRKVYVFNTREEALRYAVDNTDPDVVAFCTEGYDTDLFTILEVTPA